MATHTKAERAHRRRARHTTADEPTTSVSSHMRWDRAHCQRVKPHEGGPSPLPTCQATRRWTEPTANVLSHTKWSKPTANVLSHTRAERAHRQRAKRDAEGTDAMWRAQTRCGGHKHDAEGTNAM